MFLRTDSRSCLPLCFLGFLRCPVGCRQFYIHLWVWSHTAQKGNSISYSCEKTSVFLIFHKSASRLSGKGKFSCHSEMVIGAIPEMLFLRGKSSPRLPLHQRFLCAVLTLSRGLCSKDLHRDVLRPGLFSLEGTETIPQHLAVIFYPGAKSSELHLIKMVWSFHSGSEWIPFSLPPI